jgi:hypothetical protein
MCAADSVGLSDAVMDDPVGYVAVVDLKISTTQEPFGSITEPLMIAATIVPVKLRTTAVEYVPGVREAPPALNEKVAVAVLMFAETAPCGP